VFLRLLISRPVFQLFQSLDPLGRKPLLRLHPIQDCPGVLQSIGCAPDDGTLRRQPVDHALGLSCRIRGSLQVMS